MSARGADIIDLGALPETPFPHLEESVRLLKHHGLQVSVDSFSIDKDPWGRGRVRISC